MKDAITRADETRDGELGLDLPRHPGRDELAAIGDSITLLTYWGRIKATVLEISDPPREGMRLQLDIGSLLSRMDDSSEQEPEYRRLAVKLRLRNLDDGPFDRNRAIVPVMREYVVGSDGKNVSGAPIGPASQYGSTELPEPGQPSSTGWIGFHLHPDAEPQAFVLEGLGQQSGLWRLERGPSNPVIQEDDSRAVLLEMLKQGFAVWNPWRSTRPHLEIDLAHADLMGMDLAQIDFSGMNLARAAFSGANLDGAQFIGAQLRHAGFHDCKRFTHCDFSDADLCHASFARAFVSHAHFRRALLNHAFFVDCRCHSTDFSDAVLKSTTAYHSQFWSCNLEGVHFDGSDLTEAMLFESEFPRSTWKRVKLVGATLRHSNLRGSTFLDSDLYSADLSGTDLSDSTIVRCDLSEVGLVGANLQGSTLSELRVYGVSAWGINGSPASQGNLITTPRDQADLVVDDLEFAQFMYLISTNEKVKNAIDTITSKAVLILGRFTDERLSVLRAIRERLRAAGLVPILFDFDKPHSKDTTGVVETVARMARFIIADLTDPSSVPHELATIVPHLRTTPVQPLRLAGSSGYSMYRDLEAYKWFLKVHEYADAQALINALPELTERAEGMARDLRNERSDLNRTG